MSACVIDASAVLAYLFGERGGDEAEVWMGRAPRSRPRTRRR